MDRAYEEKLIERAKAGDSSAVSELVEHHLRYVRMFARKMGRYGVPIEELVQDGSIGLLEAIPLYDSSKGVRFLTYAGHRVRMHIYRAVFEFASKGMAGRGSAWGRMFFRLSRQLCQAEAEAGEGADPLAVVAEAQTKFGLNVTADQVQQILAMQKGPLSLEWGDSETGSILDVLSSSTAPPDEAVAATEEVSRARQVTHAAMESLDTREIAAVVLYDLYDDKTSLHEVARIIGMGKETARMIRNRGVEKLERAAARERRLAEVRRLVLQELARRPMSQWALRKRIRREHTLVAIAVRTLLREGKLRRSSGPRSRISLARHDTYADHVDFPTGRFEGREA